MSGSTFSGNSASDGGAIVSGDHGGDQLEAGDGIVSHVATETNTLKVSNSTFAGNSATAEGGAIDFSEDADRRRSRRGLGELGQREGQSGIRALGIERER